MDMIFKMAQSQEITIVKYIIIITIYKKIKIHYNHILLMFQIYKFNKVRVKFKFNFLIYQIYR